MRARGRDWERGYLCSAVHDVHVYTYSQEEITELKDQLSAKDKDVREVKSAFREAQDEVTRITDK